MNNQTEIEQDLGQIADMLLLNGTLTECPGLAHGKIGIATFFFHYAQHTDNVLFADYAMDLIGEMLDQIHVNSPADYEKGIAGIGTGIDYLIWLCPPPSNYEIAIGRPNLCHVNSCCDLQ